MFPLHNYGVSPDFIRRAEKFSKTKIFHLYFYLIIRNRCRCNPYARCTIRTFWQIRKFQRFNDRLSAVRQLFPEINFRRS